MLFSRLVKALVDTTVSYQDLGISNAENMYSGVGTNILMRVDREGTTDDGGLCF